MEKTNGKDDDTLKVRLCEAIEQLDVQEAWKAVRVATFPLEVMPEDERPAVVDRLIAHNLTTGLGFINWSVLAEDLERRVASRAGNTEEAERAN
jgi:hypothetical protein